MTFWDSVLDLWTGCIEFAIESVFGGFWYDLFSSISYQYLDVLMRFAICMFMHAWPWLCAQPWISRLWCWVCICFLEVVRVFEHITSVSTFCVMGSVIELRSLHVKFPMGFIEVFVSLLCGGCVRRAQTAGTRASWSRSAVFCGHVAIVTCVASTVWSCALVRIKVWAWWQRVARIFCRLLKNAGTQRARGNGKDLNPVAKN